RTTKRFLPPERRRTDVIKWRDSVKQNSRTVTLGSRGDQPTDTALDAKDDGFMQTGIIGLPQVGKTTLFRILTKANIDAKGAQATHVGVAKVPEPRLADLAKLYNPKKITNASVQYVDLPGVQKERMRESLATLREVDAIAHVIRVFEDPSVPHSEGNI